ncbi:HlyD family secretion protein [Pseudomonas aeruginosa]|nr:HlyD family secretion protein [Pseudomonas aeruginosa]
MVDKVRVGLPVELMFSAFNQSTTPRVEGEVTLVSPTACWTSAARRRTTGCASA